MTEFKNEPVEEQVRSLVAVTRIRTEIRIS